MPLKYVLDMLQSEEAFTGEEYKHTHTHTHTHTYAITIIPNILKIVVEANQVYNNIKTAAYADDLTTAG